MKRKKKRKLTEKLSVNYDLYIIFIECFSLQIIITDSQLAAYAIAQICLQPREDP